MKSKLYYYYYYYQIQCASLFIIGLFWFIHLFETLFRHAIVNDLAAFGATVHTCSRTESELNKCLQEWQSQGFLVTGSVCDVASRPQRENLVQQVTSTFNGKLNIFVSTDACAKHINELKKNIAYYWQLYL